MQIEQKFNIDKIDLMSRFATLQSVNHPDHSLASHAKALDITNAYETLKEEIKRGQAILDIYNIDINTIAIPSEFFTTIIDIDLENAQILYNETLDNIYYIGIINENNINLFAKEFLKLKYLKAKLMHNK